MENVFWEELTSFLKFEEMKNEFNFSVQPICNKKFELLNIRMKKTGNKF